MGARHKNGKHVGTYEKTAPRPAGSAIRTRELAALVVSLPAGRGSAKSLEMGKDRLLLHGNGRDFDLRSTDQARNLDCGPRWFRVWHKLLVDIVHFRHIVQVCDINDHGCYVRHLKAGFLNYFFDCGNCVCSL